MPGNCFDPPDVAEVLGKDYASDTLGAYGDPYGSPCAAGTALAIAPSESAMEHVADEASDICTRFVLAVPCDDAPYRFEVDSSDLGK